MNQKLMDTTVFRIYRSEGSARDIMMLTSMVNDAVLTVPGNEVKQCCDSHDVAIRNIRTGDDRIVCWFIWWSEMAEKAYPTEAPRLHDACHPMAVTVVYE